MRTVLLTHTPSASLLIPRSVQGTKEFSLNHARNIGHEVLRVFTTSEKKLFTSDIVGTARGKKPGGTRGIGERLSGRCRRNANLRTCFAAPSGLRPAVDLGVGDRLLLSGKFNALEDTNDSDGPI